MSAAAPHLREGLARYLSPEQMETLARARVGIAGAGGLGSNLAAHLARSGVGRLVIADFDTVEASNLNRQLFFTDQIGQPKVDALAQNLLRINPDLELSLHRVRLEPGNLDEVFGNCRLMAEAFDEPPAKKMLAEYCLNSGRFLVAASGLGGWGAPQTMRARRIKPGFWLVGDQRSPAGEKYPPMSPRVGMAAAMQADILLGHILGPNAAPADQ